MKRLNHYLSKLTCGIVLLIASQGCIEKTHFQSNGQISSGKRSDFHDMNAQALKYLQADDAYNFGFLASKDLMDDSYTNRSIGLISNRLESNSYTLFDEYYVASHHVDDSLHLTSSNKRANKYSLYFKGLKGESYIALFVPKTGQDNWMITLTYYKFDYGWKISGITLSPYAINGKTAPELFKLAEDQYGKNYLVNAVSAIQLSNECLRPSDLWQYPEEGEINKFCDRLINQANATYKFPFVLGRLATKPRIFRVLNHATAEGTYPMIYYLSAIKLTDTTAIKKENEEIKKMIGTVIPGIDKDKKMLLYSAFNEMPNSEHSVDHFDMVDKLQ